MKSKVNIQLSLYNKDHLIMSGQRKQLDIKH